MWIMVAGLAGAAIGVLIALQLRTLRYRRPDEQNQPRPKAAWWLIPAAGIGAWILHVASRGGLGFGDVKLITILAAALALIHPRLVLPALLAASLIGILTARLTHRREFEFGPSLAIGSILAIGLQATIN